MNVVARRVHGAGDGYDAKLLCFSALFAILNLVWEFLQLPLYKIWWEKSWGQILFALAHCTLGDVLIGIFCFASALVIRRVWFKAWSVFTWQFIAVFVMLGFAYTVYSEWQNVVISKTWAYSAAMPLVPPLGTGLSPLLQWIVVPLLAFRLARKTGSTSPTV